MYNIVEESDLLHLRQMGSQKDNSQRWETENTGDYQQRLISEKTHSKRWEIETDFQKDTVKDGKQKPISKKTQ